MLFSSTEYLLVFLPAVFGAYFLLNRLRSQVAAKSLLLIASIGFYAWWSVPDLGLLAASILFNFAIGIRLARSPRNTRFRRQLLAFAIVVNLAVLGCFKYADFAVMNANLLLGTRIELPGVALPLAVSFFTFTQIAYLVDSYRGEAREYSLGNYLLFVTFFPHLIAGPILHHAEMMPQFESRRNFVLRYSNVAFGLLLISVGVFKKVVLADTFAVWATAGFDKAVSLDLLSAWVTSLSYTFQLYFDFSGYTDMALGSALLFNIRLPINFNSPYKACDIQDFWRRWHMTLSRFLRDYLYIPLGGNRRGAGRTYVNLGLTFVLGGLWHGASWMFVIWGALHGAGIIVHRIWQRLGIELPGWLSWLITFNFVNLAWVFFRAKDMGAALKVLAGMAGLSGVVLPPSLASWLQFLDLAAVRFGQLPPEFGAIRWAAAWLVAGFVVVLMFRNSNEIAPSDRTMSGGQLRWAIASASMALVSLVAIMASTYSEFIYFNF